MDAIKDVPWIPYNRVDHIRPGSQIKFNSKFNSSKIGIVNRFMTKNFRVTVDGQDWRIPPELITHHRYVSTQAIPATIQTKFEFVDNPVSSIKPTTSLDRFATEAKIGDVCLFYRGSHTYDIIRIVSMNKNSVRGLILNGRLQGQTRGFRADWFVQVLDKTRFVEYP